MKNIMKSRKTIDSTRRKGRDAQADPDEDYLDQDYDDYDNEEEERIRRIKNKVLVRVSYLMVALFLSMAGYLIYFNVVLRDDINNNQYNTKQSAYQEQIIRGNIYSADGNVLAQTLQKTGQRAEAIRTAICLHILSVMQQMVSPVSSRSIIMIC